MTTVGLFLSRLRSSAIVFAALGVVVFVSSLALGATVGSVQSGVAQGGREVLAAAAPQSAAVRVTTHLADDGERQAAAAAAMFDDLFPAGTIEVHTRQRSLPVDLPGGSTAVFGVEPALLDAATITAGGWPADGVAVQEDAARELGLAVGDTFVVGGGSEQLPLLVDALWRADDPTAPQWFAESTIGSGRDGDAFGVVVVDPTTFRKLPTQLFVSWTASATTDALAPDTIAAVGQALDHLHGAVQSADGVVEISASTDGTLAATLERIADAGRGAAAIALSALVIVGLLALVAVVQVSSVIVGSRRPHTDLLRARGLSRWQLAALAVAEAAVVALPASVLGQAATVAIVGGGVSAGVVATAVAVGVATVVCFVGAVLFDARPAARDETAKRSPAGFLVIGTVLAAAAALATWRLFSTGPTDGVDVVTATSPALAVVAASVLGCALLYPASAALARRAARSAPVGTVLAARQVASRVARYLVPSLALAVAVASGVFATGLATTWASTERDVQFVGDGGDVAVMLGTDGAAAITARPFAPIEGADAAAALLVASVGLGSDRLPFVAVRPDAAARVIGEPSRSVVAALKTTSPDDPGLPLPAGATSISARVTGVGDGSAPTSVFDVGVWAADADGSLSRVALAPRDDDWSAPLPAGVGPWTLLAVESLRTGKADRATARIEVSRIAGSTAAPVTLDVTGSSPRAIAGIAPVDEESALPVVVTTALAARIGLVVGDPLEFTFEPTGKNIEAVVSAVTPRLPGVSSKLALGTDLVALDAVTLRPGGAPAEANAVWLRTGEPSAVGAAVARDTPSTAIVSTRASTSSEPVLATALDAFWLAALVAGLLALVAVAAFFTDDFRGRRGDIAVLRALGFSPRAQASTRSRELVAVLGFAALVGAATGAGVTALTVGPFIASAVPATAAFVSVAPAFDPVPWLAFCGVLAVLAAAVGSALVAAVRRSATSAVDGVLA